MAGRRYWEWEPVFRLTPGRTALLIVDMQRGFLEEDSPLFVPMARDQVPTIRGLLDLFRRHRWPVAFTVFCVGPQFHIPFYWRIARQRGLPLEPPECYFWEGRPEAEIIPELAPRQGEKVVRKAGYDAFAHTDLDQYLRAQGVTDLVVCGTVTNWCVDSTVRSAYHRLYNVVVVADGVSTYDHAGATAEQWQAMELDLFAEAFGRVLRADEVARELEAG